MGSNSGYSLQLKFLPTFNRPSLWLIGGNRESTDFLIEVSDSSKPDRFEVTTRVEGAPSALIHDTAEKAFSNMSLWERQSGLDGISVEGTYVSPGGEALEFSFWSPQKGDMPHQLIEAVFDSIDAHDLGQAWENYFDSLTMYFDLGPRVRIIKGSPDKLRISCFLSADMAEELESKISIVAKSPDLVVDLRRFRGMESELVKIFKPLVKRDSSTKWLAPREALRYLSHMKVPEEMIEVPEKDDEEF